ncbi:zinc-binding dehydrogenase [bacterium]|nr:zinc-binding dehydrogenase [bacterium]
MPAGPVDNRVFYYTAPRTLEVKPEACPPPGPGQVRCRTLCGLVSIGTEMICYERNVEPGTGWDAWVQYPFEPGYSSVGEVVDVGPGVENVKPGQIVCSTAAHRAWFVDRADLIHLVPEGITPEQAAWFCLNIIVQNGLRESKPTLGENAVVVGLGPLGQLAVRLLGLAGMSRLIAVDPMPSRCTLAQGNGPTDVICSTCDKAEAKIAELTGGTGAEIVYDITGHPAVFHSAFRMLGKRGRLGLIGDVPWPSQQNLTQDVIGKSISIISAHATTPPWEGNSYYRWGKKELVQFFFKMLAQKRISLEGLVTHRITPDQAPQTYADIFADRSRYLGVIIDWRKGA